MLVRDRMAMITELRRQLEQPLIAPAEPALAATNPINIYKALIKFFSTVRGVEK